MASRSLDDAIAAAIARGAIREERADHYRAVARRDGAAGTVARLDVLAGGVVEAGAPRPRGAWHTEASAPPGANPDLFAANPLLAELRRTKPGLVGAAMAENPDPPRLFGDTDLPPFTASGLPVTVLTSLPWPLRRPVAQASTLRAAYELVDKYQGAEGAAMAATDLAYDGVNAPYLEAMRTWLIGSGRAPADMDGSVKVGSQAGAPGTMSGLNDYTTEQLHREIFGPA